MAKEPSASEKPKELKRGFTTLRIYEDNGENMSDLAALLGQTAADVYDQHCAPIIRKLLREKMQEKLKKLN